ncbi:hypothetical protein [Salinigranum sp. GCM10025319]|uniref:hypothetical protein n=1 Tax=Salinigranum sp. GCM10025319 TaxID=3252687 RepID=UPI003618FC8D
MKFDRLTILTPGDEPNIDVDVDEGYVRETATHVFVSTPASAVGTTDVEDYPITVSGATTTDDDLGRLEREFTYSGEITAVSTKRHYSDGDRLQLRCQPASLRSRHPRTAPRGGSVP